MIAWGALGVVGMSALSDWFMEITIGSFWTKKEFLAFVADRLRKVR